MGTPRLIGQPIYLPAKWRSCKYSRTSYLLIVLVQKRLKNPVYHYQSQTIIWTVNFKHFGDIFFVLVLIVDYHRLILIEAFLEWELHYILWWLGKFCSRARACCKSVVSPFFGAFEMCEFFYKAFAYVRNIDVCWGSEPWGGLFPTKVDI